MPRGDDARRRNITADLTALRECINLDWGQSVGKYLGIDASTQSLTGLVIDCDSSEIVEEVSINFDEHFGDRYGSHNGVIELGDGVVHSSPTMWAEALDLLLTELRGTGILGELAAVAGSGQQHGTVYLNNSAEAVLNCLRGDRRLVDQIDSIFSRRTSPIWMDTSTSDQCWQIEQGVGGRERLLELTGNTAFERFSGPQIRKFFETESQAYEATASIALVSSYMASLFAGRLVAVDPGDGSGTNLMDISTRCWSQVALDATAPGLEAKLAPIGASDLVVGPVSGYFVERFGFSEGCQVLPFSGDNPCSLIGLGLVEPGQVALSLGTSDTMFACMDEPRTSANGEGALFASPDGHNYMALICFLNGSLAREAVRDLYNLDWAGFAGLLAESSPGNDGGLMLPYFSAEIVPHVSHPGVVREGFGADEAAANVRAVIEAQALATRIHSQWMGVPVHSLSVTGGASENPQILQVYADVHDCPVHRFQTTNSAALGAALRARHGHLLATEGRADWKEVVEPFTQPDAGSTIDPNPAVRSIYDELEREYVELEKRHTS